MGLTTFRLSGPCALSRPEKQASHSLKEKSFDPDEIEKRNVDLRRKEESGTISEQEQAELSAIRQFPDVKDGLLRKLAYKELLHCQGLAGPLSKSQKAILFSFRQFPRPGSKSALGKSLAGLEYCEATAARLRELARKELSGGKLSAEEKAELCSWRRFPNNSRGRNLAFKETLERISCLQDTLTAEERAEIYRLGSGANPPSVLSSFLRSPYPTFSAA